MEISNNKRIAKNTVYLYIRMAISMVVSLYTTRVVLQVLGVSDYGIFNVVGGLIAMCSFINTAISGCTQRFLNVALGGNDPHRITKVFGVALTVHGIFALVFTAIMVPLGYYLLHNFLNISQNRLDAAGYVFLFSVLTAVVNLLSRPFDAAIIAHEKMDLYAYLSIFDVISKLLIVYFLLVFPYFDRLILYSFLFFSISTVLLLLYMYYVRKYFQDCKFQFLYDKKLLSEMTKFTGWGVFGGFSFLLSTQGLNLVFNHFCGTVINAAWGVSNQVNSILTKFSDGFETASSPQIMKLCAAKQYEELTNLIINTTKFGFYLIFVIGLPIFITIDFILSVWLSEVPDHTSLFVRVMIVEAFVFVINFPISRTLVGTGRIETSSYFAVITQAITLGISYLLLYCGVDVDYVICIQLLPMVLGYAFTLYLLNNYIGIINKTMLVKIFVPIFEVIIVSIIFPSFLFFYLENNLIGVAVVVIFSILSVCVSVYFIGIDSQTRLKIKYIISNKIHSI